MSEDELRNIFNELIDKELDENFLCGYSYRQWQKPEAIEQRKITGFEDFKLGYNLANNLSKQLEKLQATREQLEKTEKILSEMDKYLDYNDLTKVESGSLFHKNIKQYFQDKQKDEVKQ